MDLLEIERSFLEEGIQNICGVDEAGRGPVAGPVFAAAVILPPGLSIVGLNDSKKLAPKKRDRLFSVITDSAVSYGIASASVDEIEELNILNATFLAMRRAVAMLSPEPSLALIDGNMARDFTVPVRCIVGGDAKCASIAAASVLAKVARDRHMVELSLEYPRYAFEKHKGYGTKLHLERIAEFGLSPHHRRSFLRRFAENDY